jgi:hypothetical protein
LDIFIMSESTLSAYADEMTAQRIAQFAMAEDRSPAQIAAAALRLYVSPPTEAHQAFHQIEAMESPVVFDAVQRAMTRVLIDGVYDAARQRAVSQMRVSDQEDDSEQAILACAVLLTSPH